MNLNIKKSKMTEIIEYRSKKYVYIHETRMWREYRSNQIKNNKIRMLTGVGDKFSKYIVFTNVHHVWNGKKRVSIKKSDYLIDGLVRTANLKKVNRSVIEYIQSYTNDNRIIRLIAALVRNKYYLRKKIIIFDYETKPILDIILEIFRGEYSCGSKRKMSNTIFIYHHVTDINQIDAVLSSKVRIVNIVYNDTATCISLNKQLIRKLNSLKKMVVLYNKTNNIEMNICNIHDIRNIMYSFATKSFK